MSLASFQETITFSLFCFYFFEYLVPQNKNNNKFMFLFPGFSNLWSRLLKWVCSLTTVSIFLQTFHY